MIQNEPGMFIGPIAMVFGWIIDIIFNVVNSITVYHSLGLSIILLTIIVRTFMLPLAMKQQKSMAAMQRLNPEVQKIRDKYKGKKDSKEQQQMNAEIQKLYSDNKVNPLGGCLPLFLQMPLFFGLSFIMHQSHLYVSRLGNLFSQVSETLHTVPGYTNIIVPLALPRATQRMLDNQEIDISVVSHLNRVLNAFDVNDWNAIFAQVPAEVLPTLQYLHGEITAVQTFFGMVLTDNTGLGWPGIMIPILAVLSALATSYVTMKSSIITDERQKQQQKMMMMIMPVMMGVMTVGLPAGVGIFWITSSVYQIGQQLLLNKKMGIGMGIGGS